jgi:hypothetical protein
MSEEWTRTAGRGQRAKTAEAIQRADQELARRRLALRKRINESGDADLLALMDERDFLEMANCGWREISVEWALLARKLVPEDFDFGHGCPTCTISRVLTSLDSNTDPEGS